MRDLHRVPGRTPSQIETCLIRALFAALLIASGLSVAHAAAPAWAAECAAQDDDASRLACYDSRNPPRKSAARAPSSTPPAASSTAAAQAAGSTSSTAASPATAPAPAPAANSDFGLTEARQRESAKAKAAEATDLVAHVASVSERLTGEVLLKLDNGQSWTQAQRKSGVVIKAGERVSIARGAFGGYLLRSDSGVTMRVRRLE